MFKVRNGSRLDEIGLKDSVEPAPGISVREFLLVLFKDRELRHSLLPEHPCVLRHAGHCVVISPGLGLVLDGILLEEVQQFEVVHREDFLDGLPALVEGGDVLLHGVP